MRSAAHLVGAGGGSWIERSGCRFDGLPLFSGAGFDSEETTWLWLRFGVTLCRTRSTEGGCAGGAARLL